MMKLSPAKQTAWQGHPMLLCIVQRFDADFAANAVNAFRLSALFIIRSNAHVLIVCLCNTRCIPLRGFFIRSHRFGREKASG